MKAAGNEVEQAYLRQIDHLEGIRDCLVIERDNLINLDVDGLWQVSEEKQRLLATAEENANVLKSLKEAGSLNSEGSQSEKLPAFKELSRKTALLKEEIRAMAAENMSVIRDSLSFIEELMGIFTQEEQSGNSYGRAPGKGRNLQPYRLSREV